MNHEPKSIKLLHYGDIIKANTFDTAKGCYTIRIISHNDSLYFQKMINGNVVEVVSLNKPT